MRKVLLGILCALIPATLVLAATGYHVVGEIMVGGDGGWDSLTADSAARRLYVSHATHVVVVDLDSGKVVGDIPDTPGVHGIALAPQLNRGFVSNGRTNTVTIFDLKTLKAIGEPVPTGGMNPDSIRYEPVSQRVFTFNGRSNDSTVIDAKTGKVVGMIKFDGNPEFTQADGKGKIYANIESTSEIVEIDAAKAMVTKKYSLAPCMEPSGLAFDEKDRKLFSVCSNRVMVVSDPDSGKVIANAAIGPGSDGVAYDASQGLAFSSNGGDGTLTVVQNVGGKWQVTDNIATERGGRTIAIDDKTHKIYVPTATVAPSATGGGRATYLPNTFKVVVIGK